MKRFVSKPTTDLQPSTSASGSMDASPEAIFDVQELLDRSGVILQREIRNLMNESQRGKLSAPSSRDLVAYIKLLEELKTAEKEKLSSMTDDELLAMSKK